MKEKRYTLQEEQPIPIGWHPAMKKKPWLELKLLRKSMRMGNILMQMTLKKN